MNENKFSPRAEEALRLSQEAAGELGHGYVGTEHLLLGLIREEEGVAHTVLAEAGLTDDMIVEIIKKSVGAGLPGSNPAQGLTPRAKRVVELAMEDSMRGGYNYVGTEHLLAGILREGNNMAVRILRPAGVDARRLYTALMQTLGELPRQTCENIFFFGIADNTVKQDPEGVHPGPDRRRSGRQAGPGHRPGRGDPAGDPDSLPPHQEQPLPDRCARGGQNRHR